MSFFSKWKDYNNLLEEILDKKTFSSIAKSLCLSMIYKLEISYRDYAKVNVDCVSRDVFFSSILESIRNYCEHIKIVEPESSQANLLIKNHVNVLTNTKERSILSYPTELAMLEAITDIEPKYFFMKKDFQNREVFQKILVKGHKESTLGILKNFNGWSWDINLAEEMDDVANCIYQNLMMIKGEQFLYDWRIDTQGKKNYLSDLKRSIKSVTGNDDYYECLCHLLEMLQSKEKEETIKQEVMNLQKHFLKFMVNKIEKALLREDMLKIIYQLRFYQNLRCFEVGFMKDCDEINVVLNYALKIAITKACKLGVIKIVSMDIETNFMVFKYIFDTRIIELEQIKIYLELDEENILLKVYDKEVFEKQGKIKWKGNKKDIVIRKKKMISVFN